MGKKIFIGGTGKSGTTILSKFIGNHRNIYKIPIESRFIVDKNGLINLFDALTQNYSLDQGRIALRDFEQKILNLSQPHKSPYLGLNLENILSQNYLQKQLSELFELTSHGFYMGKDYHSKDKYQITKVLRQVLKPLDYFLRGINKLFNGHSKSMIPLYDYKGVYPEEEIFIPQYFKNEKELVKILRDFVDSLFLKAAQSNNKMHWCEDTPGNALHFDRLAHIFQDAFFIQIMRHPVGVAFSMNRQRWAPNDYNQICDLLDNLYKKLRSVHETCSTDKAINYKFVKLENLTSESRLQSVVNFIGVENDFTEETIFKKSRMNYYQDTISTKDLDYIQKKLKNHIDYFEYKTL